jgi:hypothetical protein
MPLCYDWHHFFCDHLNLSTLTLPDPIRLTTKLAALHLRSHSPTNKFSFHVTTFNGKLPLNTSWNASH